MFYLFFKRFKNFVGNIKEMSWIFLTKKDLSYEIIKQERGVKVLQKLLLQQL